MMKRGQVIVLLSMTAIALSLFGYVTVMGISLANADDGNPFDVIGMDALGLSESTESTKTDDSTNPPSAAVAQSSSPTPIPSNTPTATVPATIAPTHTATMVVDGTATSTSTKTPIPTKTATPTSTPVVVAAVNRGGSGSSNSSATIRQPATAVPVSRYPFRLIDGPVEYDTENTFFVILAKVTNGAGYLSNYKLVGYHQGLGLEWKSIPSCDHMCKASSPVGVHNDDGKLIKKFGRQEANLAFEFPHYENGIFNFVLVNPEGAQVSEPFQIELNAEDGKRRWYYLHFSQ